MHIVEHINFVTSSRRGKLQIRIYHTRRVDHRICPVCAAIRTLVTTYTRLRIFVATQCITVIFIRTLAVFQGLIRNRGSLQIPRQRHIWSHRKTIRTNLCTIPHVNRIHVTTGFVILIGSHIPVFIVAKELHGCVTHLVVIYLIQMLNRFFGEVFEVRMIRLKITNNNIQRTDILSVLSKSYRAAKQCAKGNPFI